MKKYKLVFSLIRNIISILRFNFHYFPLSQAIKLPVFLNHAHLHVMKGTVRIETDRIRPGMIRFGYPWTCMKQNKGFHWLNSGGVIISDRLTIANDSVVEIGKDGILKIGKNVSFNGGLRLSCQKSITIGDFVLGSWDVSMFDTDFHRMKNCLTHDKIKSCSLPVVVGDNCWIGFGVTIMKGSQLGNGCIVGAKSLLAKNYSKAINTVFAGNPALPKKKGFYLDHNDCKPEYEDK